MMENVALRLPFAGNWPITLGFNKTTNDPEIQEKFNQWGLIGHHGIDFGLPLGTPVLASYTGQVVHRGPLGDFGLTVILEHPWGQSLYGHLQKVQAAAVTRVAAGKIIGFSGQTGAAFGPHLHFAIKPKNPNLNNGFLGFIDPLPYLSPVMIEPDVAANQTLDLLRQKANQVRRKKRKC